MCPGRVFSQFGMPPTFHLKDMALYNPPPPPGLELMVYCLTLFISTMGANRAALFHILAMEHLVIAIKSSHLICGLPIFKNEYKVGLYTDNLLLYIFNPNIGLPALIQGFKTFKKNIDLLCTKLNDSSSRKGQGSLCKYCNDHVAIFINDVMFHSPPPCLRGQALMGKN